jgi:threonine dehydrogenase-like Zn-dependent dehydrogenase
MIRGTVTGMKPGTILGHEGVGLVEEVGQDVRNFKRGDRLVIPSTIACGSCNYCRGGYFSQCDNANPGGPQAGTCFYGGPAEMGSFNGLQAELALIPFANVGMVRLPDDVDDDEAILLSDIIPTAYFGAKLAEITDGDIVGIFGCGPVGQFAIMCAKLLGARRVIAIDKISSRLEMAQSQGAEVINFDEEDPIEMIKKLTQTGLDRAIDAVGIDAYAANGEGGSLGQEVKNVAQRAQSWAPGDDEDSQRSSHTRLLASRGSRAPLAPNQALEWAVESLAKAGTLAIIGVYPPTFNQFPLGKAMGKNLSILAGNCNHRGYMDELIALVANGTIPPEVVLTQQEPFVSVIDAYKNFSQHQPGWIKVMLDPSFAESGGGR